MTKRKGGGKGEDATARFSWRMACAANDLAAVLFSLLSSLITATMNAGSTPSNANESYCTFTLAPDVTVGGLPSQEEIAKDLESTDTNVR